MGSDFLLPDSSCQIQTDPYKLHLKYRYCVSAQRTAGGCPVSLAIVQSAVLSPYPPLPQTAAQIYLRNAYTSDDFPYALLPGSDSPYNRDKYAHPAPG